MEREADKTCECGGAAARSLSSWPCPEVKAALGAGGRPLRLSSLLGDGIQGKIAPGK